MKYYEAQEQLVKAMYDADSEAVYIMKPNIFSDEYDTLLNSFKNYYKKTEIAYSFKTNYVPDLINIVKNKGGYAEVVSIMELELALKVGFKPAQIFFNGPFKHTQETIEYLRQGVLVNVDSYDEFNWINQVSKELKITCRIGVRLNFCLNKDISRFGIDVHNGDVMRILNEVNNAPYLSLESLHYHYASRDLFKWKECVDAFLIFMSNIEKDLLRDLRYISLGGGMFSDMSPYLKKQIANNIPSFIDYAENSIKILSPFLNTFNKYLKTDIEVLIEPGTALAAKSVDFVVKVVSIKSLGGCTFINTTGSKYNMNPSPNRINSPTKVVNLSENSAIDVKNSKLCGYTCIETDIIHDNFYGRVAKDDLIIFEEVGAYSIVMKPPFILPDVAVLEFDDARGVFKVRRERQNFGDIFSNFTFFDEL